MVQEIYSKIEYYIESGNKLSLADKIGIAVLYANKYTQLGDSKSYNILNVMLYSILDQHEYQESNVVNGFSGVLWLLKYLKKNHILSFSQSTIKNIENASIEKFKTSLSLNRENWSTSQIAEQYKSLYRTLVGK